MARALSKFIPGNEPSPGSDRWLDLVDQALLSGFGVEDIAIWMHCPADRVRRHVQSLRGHGVLSSWWGC